MYSSSPKVSTPKGGRPNRAFRKQNEGKRGAHKKALGNRSVNTSRGMDIREGEGESRIAEHAIRREASPQKKARSCNDPFLNARLAKQVRETRYSVNPRVVAGSPPTYSKVELSYPQIGKRTGKGKGQDSE